MLSYSNLLPHLSEKLIDIWSWSISFMLNALPKCISKNKNKRRTLRTTIFDERNRYLLCIPEQFAMNLVFGVTERKKKKLWNFILLNLSAFCCSYDIIFVWAHSGRKLCLQVINKNVCFEERKQKKSELSTEKVLFSVVLFMNQLSDKLYNPNKFAHKHT